MTTQELIKSVDLTADKNVMVFTFTTSHNRKATMFVDTVGGSVSFSRGGNIALRTLRENAKIHFEAYRYDLRSWWAGGPFKLKYIRPWSLSELVGKPADVLRGVASLLPHRHL